MEVSSSVASCSPDYTKGVRRSDLFSSEQKVLKVWQGSSQSSSDLASLVFLELVAEDVTDNTEVLVFISLHPRIN